MCLPSWFYHCLTCVVSLATLAYFIYSIAWLWSPHAASDSLAAAVARRVGRQAARAAAHEVLESMGDDDS